MEGTRPIAVELRKSATGAGTGAECRVAEANAPVTAGRFAVTLTDADCVDMVRNNADVWAEVQVGGVPVGARQRLGAVPRGGGGQRPHRHGARARRRRCWQRAAPLAVHRHRPAGWSDHRGLVAARRRRGGGGMAECLQRHAERIRRSQVRASKRRWPHGHDPGPHRSGRVGLPVWDRLTVPRAAVFRRTWRAAPRLSCAVTTRPIPLARAIRLPWRPERPSMCARPSPSPAGASRSPDPVAPPRNQTN